MIVRRNYFDLQESQVIAHICHINHINVWQIRHRRRVLCRENIRYQFHEQSLFGCVNQCTTDPSNLAGIYWPIMCKGLSNNHVSILRIFQIPPPPLSHNSNVRKLITPFPSVFISLELGLCELDHCVITVNNVSWFLRANYVVF